MKTFELISEDTEWMYSTQLTDYIEGLRNSLSNLTNKASINEIHNSKSVERNYQYKVIVKDGRSFASTDDEAFNLNGMTLKDSEFSLLEVLFGSNDLYSEIVWGKDYFVLHGHYYRAINLYELPKAINFGELIRPILKKGQSRSLLNLIPYFCFRKYPKEYALNVLNKMKKPHMANETKGSSKLGNLEINKESEKSLGEIEAMIDMIQDGDEGLFDFQFWYFLKEDSLEELNKVTNDALNFIQILQGLPLVETVGMKHVVKNVVEESDRRFHRSHLVQGAYVAAVLPCLNDQLYDEGVKFTSSLGNEIFLDIYNAQNLNYNLAIDGTSGGGKSFVTNYLVKELLEQDVSVVILDSGDNFEKLTKYHDGIVFSEKFNPMQFKDVFYLKNFVLSFIPNNYLINGVEGKIFEGITEFLQKNSTPSFSGLINHLESQLNDIKYYFSEVWQFISDEDLPLNRLTYVNRDKYPKRIQDGLVIFLMEYVSSHNGKKAFVVDEAWEAFRNLGEYIEKKGRQFRHQWGSLITITQSVKDYEDSKSGANRNIGDIIKDISFHRLHFYQNDYGELDPEIGEVIRSLRTVKTVCSRFLYRNPNKKKVCEYWATYLEHELFTSEVGHNAPMKRFIGEYEEYFGFVQSMHKWVDFKYLLGGKHEFSSKNS